MNDPMVREYADLLKQALTDVTSDFTHTLESRFQSLSPREIEVCNLIRSGYSTKQIAGTLKTSLDTVKNQRKAIRRKLGISKTDANLESLLRSL